MAKANSTLKTKNDLVNEEMRSRFNNHANADYPEQQTTTTDKNNNNNQKFNVNFNSAIFNKNFLEQTIHDERTRQKKEATLPSESSIVNLGNFIGNEPVYMNDDLSLLPHIDEKSIFNVLKNKFEVQKYHVKAFFVFNKDF